MGNFYKKNIIDTFKERIEEGKVDPFFAEQGFTKNIDEQNFKFKI